MKNPWKQSSKVNPQAEKGYRRIANEVFLALIRAPLSASELKVVFCIIDKTWGFRKTSDVISKSQLVNLTGLSKSSVGYAIRSLKRKNIIYYESSGLYAHGSRLNEFLFNKYYDTWSVWSELGQDFDIVRILTQSKLNDNYIKNGQKQDQIVDPTKESKEMKDNPNFIKF